MGTKYYDGTALLSKKDINGNTPEIYLVTTNRAGGKTTWFSKKLVEDFIRDGKKFLLLYRFNYELDNLGDSFFKDIGSLFFRDYSFEAVKAMRGMMCDLYLCKDKERMHCGYAITLGLADTIKKKSHMLSDVAHIYMDEFQSETDHYCENEIIKFMSVHNTVARGQGKQSRYVPTYLVGNTVSLLNPYYVALGISSRMRKDTRFLKGNGWVCEQGFVESASIAQSESAFMKAFENEAYNKFSAQAVYLNDSDAFIGKPAGKCFYKATVRYKGKNYGIFEFPDAGYMYASTRYDKDFPFRYALTLEDHSINYLLLAKPDYQIQQWRYIFDHGAFRFQNLECKQMVIDLLRY